MATTMISPSTNIVESAQQTVSRSSAPPVMIGSKPTIIDINGTTMRFLIMDAPRKSNLHLYLRECRKHQVTDVVRVCEPTYPGAELESAGVKLHEMPYSDGHSPPDEILDRWLKLVDDRFYHVGSSQIQQSYVQGNPTGAGNLASVSNSFTHPTIAVHCVAGLGRAPVLVAIALVEFANMDPVEAVTLIRKHRRGAINEKQLNWLGQYQKRYKKGGISCCAIM